jgi:hypothetical protein
MRKALYQERGRRLAATDAIRKALDPQTPRAEAQRIARRLLADYADLLTLDEVRELAKLLDDGPGEPPAELVRGRRQRDGEER